MKRRNLILLLGGASSGAMTMGTGAFSSAQVDRGVEVNVVDDESALVGYRSSDKVLSSDEDEIDLVEIKNRFGDDTEIKIVNIETEVEEIKGDGPTLDDDPTYPEESFAHWDGYKNITGQVSCGSSAGKSRFEVTVLVQGSGVQAELFGETETRSFIVECDPSVDDLTVEFAGNGNVFVSPDGLELTTKVLHLEPNSDGTRIEPSDGPFQWNTDKNLKNGRPEDYDSSGKLVAVGFVDRDETYYNPDYDFEEDDFPDEWDVSLTNPIEGDKRGNGPPD